MHYLSTENIFVWLFHASNLMAFLAFLLRDQLQLRVMMAVSLLLQGLYYYAIPGGPFFDPLFWKIISFLANAMMIVMVFSGRLDFGIPADLRGLFEKISVLSPGQFRKLVSNSTRTLASEVPLITHGMKPDSLHYLLVGSAHIIKGTNQATIPAGVFLGEIAFLNNQAATATVQLAQNSLCVTWNSTQLRQLMQRDKAIEIALRGVFNADLAAKVSNSLPLPYQKDAKF
jgi:Popeye protein conserved region